MPKQGDYSIKKVKSPVGELLLVAGTAGLAAVLWSRNSPRARNAKENLKHPILLKTEKQLAEYFAGKRKIFDIELEIGQVGTAFQKKVWRALLEIPFGETKSYAEIARRIGNAKSSRAVGAAIGRNPIAIVVPCHRVIGASGRLTGFAGGLSAKKLLLELENKRTCE